MNVQLVPLYLYLYSRRERSPGRSQIWVWEMNSFVSHLTRKYLLCIKFCWTLWDLLWCQHVIWNGKVTIVWFYGKKQVQSSSPGIALWGQICLQSFRLQAHARARTLWGLTFAPLSLTPIPRSRLRILMHFVLSCKKGREEQSSDASRSEWCFKLLEHFRIRSFHPSRQSHPAALSCTSQFRMTLYGPSLI